MFAAAAGLPILALLSMLAACPSAGGEARRAAERFVDEHYVTIDLEAAKRLCSGVAARKVEKELALTRGQAIDETTRKPKVHYRLQESRGGDDSPVFVFEGTIEVEDGGTFQRKWLVTTGRDGGSWKVSNFEEFE